MTCCRRLAASTLTLIILATALVAIDTTTRGGRPAGAAELTAPDTGGYFGRCAFRWANGTSPGPRSVLSWVCNIADTNAEFNLDPAAVRMTITGKLTDNSTVAVVNYGDMGGTAPQSGLTKTALPCAYADPCTASYNAADQIYYGQRAFANQALDFKPNGWTVQFWKHSAAEYLGPLKVVSSLEAAGLEGPGSPGLIPPRDYYPGGVAGPNVPRLLSSPDSDGNYAQCSLTWGVDVGDIGGGIGGEILNWSCNVTDPATFGLTAADIGLNIRGTRNGTPRGVVGYTDFNGTAPEKGLTKTSLPCAAFPTCSASWNATDQIHRGQRSQAGTVCCYDPGGWEVDLVKMSDGTVLGEGTVVHAWQTSQQQAAVPLPPDYYEGGIAGDLFDVTSLVASQCSRTLSSVGTDAVAEFLPGNPPDAASVATDTWSWDFGDASPPATTRRATHSYVLADMPSNGWTATLTHTRTAATGHRFSTGASSEQMTCSLRVDFTAPDQSTPGSDAGTAPDNDCPSGWGWLNPKAIIDVLKCLFVPTFDFGPVLESTSNAFPFSVVTDGISVYLFLQDEIGSADSTGNACPLLPLADADDALTNAANAGGSPATHVLEDARLPCPAEAGVVQSQDMEDLGELYGFRTALRTILAVLLWAGFLWRVVRAAGFGKTAALGPGGGDGGGEDE